MTLVPDLHRTTHPAFTFDQVQAVILHAAGEAEDHPDEQFSVLRWLENAVERPINGQDFVEVCNQMENLAHAEEGDLMLHFGKPNTALVRQDLVEHYQSELNAAVFQLASNIMGGAR